MSKPLLDLLRSIPVYEPQTDLSLASMNKTFPRQGFFSQIFGGSRQSAGGRPSEVRIKQHGYDDFYYPAESYHPVTPKFIGAPGLWVEFHTEKVEFGKGNLDPPSRTIVPFAPDEWCYIGQYVDEFGLWLSKKEFKRLSGMVSR